MVMADPSDLGHGKKTHGIHKDLWYRQGLMVLTTPMVLTKTRGIETVLLNHTIQEGRVLSLCGIFHTKTAFYTQKGDKGKGGTKAFP